jgi:hypothetical protein
MADSVPFSTPSLQSGAWHDPEVQTRLVQSVVRLQVEPGAQGGQLPPQSVSVSVPSFVPLVQPAVAQTFC